MKRKLLTLFCASFFATSFAITSPSIQTSSLAKVTAYLLLTHNINSKIDAINYLTDYANTVPALGGNHVDTLVLSFMDPAMNPEKIKDDIKNNDLQQLLVDSGVFSREGIQAKDAQHLIHAIDQLKTKNIQVAFAVGGWAYSSKNPEKPLVPGTSHFPLTKDIIDDYRAAGLLSGSEDDKRYDNLKKIQAVDDKTTQDYTNAWVSAAKAFHATGIDLDYEENWFVAETSLYMPIKALKPFWASEPNGPFVIPYSVIKYAQYIKSMANSAKADSTNEMTVTMASPAVGAYDIHEGKGGAMFWCPVSGMCGSPPDDQSWLNLGGNLKGTFFDMTHYKEINALTGQNGEKYSFQYPDALFNHLFQKVDAINIMTYDLDDGYDGNGVRSSWCIGKVKDANEASPHFGSRAMDPGLDASYQQVDCSIKSQTETIMEMYKQNIIDEIKKEQGAAPHLGFGLEAGFPNYPINIDQGLPGGGDKVGDPRYRWHDPFIISSIPLRQTTSAILAWFAHPQHQQSDSTAENYHGKPDIHSAPLVVDQSLFEEMNRAGADSLILWSLNNADYNDHLSKTTPSWDYQQWLNGNMSAFDTDYANPMWSYTKEILQDIFDNAASPEDILSVANRYYYKKSIPVTLEHAGSLSSS